MSGGAIQLKLNRPPATNNLFATFGNRRIRSAKYEAWIAESLWSIAQQKPGRVEGHFKITMTVQRPDKRKRDLDGLAKAPLDLLVKAGVTDDDSLCQEILIRWESREPTGEAVFISVEAA